MHAYIAIVSQQFLAQARRPGRPFQAPTDNEEAQVNEEDKIAEDGKLDFSINFCLYEKCILLFLAN